MQAAIQMGLKSPAGKQITALFINEIAFPLAKAGVKKGAPIIAKGVKEGASVMKDCGKKAYKTVIQRYRKPDRAFVVTETTNEQDEHRFVSVSKDVGGEFLQTWYPR